MAKDRGLRINIASSASRGLSLVVSNIAEGQGRNSKGEFTQFLGNAQSSLLEVETQFLIAERLKYVDAKSMEHLNQKVDRVSRLLNGLMQSQKVKRPELRDLNEKQKTRNEKPV